MLKTIGLVVVLLLTIVLTIAACLAALFLVCAALFLLWRFLRRLLFPKQVRREKETQATYQDLLREAPHFLRSRDTHTDAVIAVAAHPETLSLVSAGRDKTLQVRHTEWNNDTDTYPLPFAPGLVCVGEQDEIGLRVAAANPYDITPDAPAVFVWNSADAPDTPPLSLFIPNLCTVHALAWDDSAQTLRVFAGVFDETYPIAPNDDTSAPNRLLLLQWELPNGSPSPLPVTLPLPPHSDELSSWEIAAHEQYALSANGLFLACRTTCFAENQTQHGVGVWNVDEARWQHRFGGREAHPHKIWAVSRDGETVYSGREDGPGRDYRNGGPEWYDGLYIWEARAAPPEGTEEARPDPSPLSGSRNMVFNWDETLMANPAFGGRVEVYDMQTKTHRQTITRPAPEDETNRYGNSVWCCTFYNNDKQLVTGHVDGQIWWWQVSPRQNIGQTSSE